MIHENLRPIFELSDFHQEQWIPLIESYGYDCLGWTVVDRASFEQNIERELRICGCNIYFAKVRMGNTCIIRLTHATADPDELMIRKALSYSARRT